MCAQTLILKHIYPPPYLIETQLASICDVANRKIMNCKLPEDFIEMAAWTTYNILNRHPFHDGNGRVVHVVIAFLLLDIQFPTGVRNWIEPLVTIKQSVPFHSYFPIECDVSPLLEWIQQSLNI